MGWLIDTSENPFNPAQIDWVSHMLYRVCP